KDFSDPISALQASPHISQPLEVDAVFWKIESASWLEFKVISDISDTSSGICLDLSSSSKESIESLILQILSGYILFQVAEYLL
ncbi:12094_t:CDS:2, partial [Funneliformis mosseae]